MKDTVSWKAVWTITRYEDDEAVARDEWYSKSTIDGNLALNEGLTALQNLLIGDAEDAFSNGNAYIGVGDDNTAAAAGQTGLQAASNKTYVAQEGGYPSISNQTTTWRSSFGAGVGTWDWNEFTVSSGNSDAADNLNRVVSAQGSKGAGNTWVVDIAITFS